MKKLIGEGSTGVVYEAIWGGSLYLCIITSNELKELQWLL